MLHILLTSIMGYWNVLFVIATFLVVLGVCQILILLVGMYICSMLKHLDKLHRNEDTK